MSAGRISLCLMLMGLGLRPIAGLAAPTCTVTTSGIAFGVVSLQNLVNVDSTGLVEISCNNPNITYTVLLSAGAGTYAQRRMIANGQGLGYNIFTSATYTSIWGDGTAGTSTVVGTVSSNANGQNNRGLHTLYGRIPLASIQQAYSGSYADVLVATITY